MKVSARSLLVAGLTVTAVGTSVSGVSGVSRTLGGAPGTAAATAYRLTAAVSPLLPPVQTAAAAEYAPATAPVSAAAAVTSAGDFIINAYNAIEPWAAWGAELIQWGMGFVPVLWWFAPGVDVAYFTAEPVVQSLVYSFADLIDGNFSQIGPTIQAGLQEAAQNFVQYSIYWFESLIPFPPLPPWPPFPGLAAAAVAPAHATRAAAAVETNETAAAPDAAPTETPATPDVSPAADAAAPAPTAATARVTKRTAVHTRTAQPAAASQESTVAPASTDAADQGAPAAQPTGKAGARSAASSGARSGR